MGHYTILTYIIFARQDAQKAPRSTMALDRRSCLFVYSTLFYVRDLFLHFGRVPLSFFCEICGRIGNEMPRKRKFWSRKKVVRKGGGDTTTVRTMNNTQLQSTLSPQQHVHERHHQRHLDKKRWGRTSLPPEGGASDGYASSGITNG